MMKLLSIILAVIMAMTATPVKKTKTGGGKGIGTAAYHEPVCGIGEAAERAP